MPEVLLDGRIVSVPPGSTLLEAARGLGIAVPALCHGEGLPHHTSCMVCLVEDMDSGRLVPACATPAGDGQQVRTGGERVLAARRRSVELLLGEHAGDCEAPCVRACPAHADIPGMARRLGRGDWEGALATLLARLPLAGSLARVCPAPCERACRRGGVDSAVRICGLKQAVSDRGLAGGAAFTPQPAPPTGARVAVVGAGPAGLSAAYFLALGGCRCTVFDERPAPGGMMRHAIPAERLPPGVLEADIALLRRLGVQLHMGETIASGKSLDELRDHHGAVVLVPGSRDRLALLLGIDTRIEDAAVDRGMRGVFAGGNAVRETSSRMSVRGVAEGRRLAQAVLLFLEGRDPLPPRERYVSRRGKLRPEDLALFAAEAKRRAARAMERRPSLEEAEVEALRCLDCGCARGRTCGLRRLAEETGADGRRFPRTEGTPFERVRGEGGLSFEPGKCIRCGLCVRIAEKGGDRPGLAFTGRGSDVRVRAPFGADIGAALAVTAAECVARCPTGALVWDR